MEKRQWNIESASKEWNRCLVAVMAKTQDQAFREVEKLGYFPISVAFVIPDEYYSQKGE